MKVKKIIYIIILMLLILFFKAESKAANENTDIETEVKITPTINKIEQDVTIPVEISVKNEKNGVYSIDVLVEYNSEIFYDLTEDDFIANVKMYTFEYNEDEKILEIIMDEPVNDGVIATINLTPRKTIKEVDEKVELFKMYDMYIVRGDYYSEYIDYMDTSIWVVGEDSTEDDKEDDTDKEEKLYLSSEAYKIGDNDIKNYEDGDKYISRIVKETTKESFISNLDTNGTIRIIKEDGTELVENELVGTGMTLEVTKDEEKIELKIAVMGDLSGDGKVTAQDLSTLNQTILKLVTVENEYKIAADLDENDKITATDLSTVNQMLLKLL